jgi:hypothetical protein
MNYSPNVIYAIYKQRRGSKGELANMVVSLLTEPMFNTNYVASYFNGNNNVAYVSNLIIDTFEIIINFNSTVDYIDIDINFLETVLLKLRENMQYLSDYIENHKLSNLVYDYVVGFTYNVITIINILNTAYSPSFSPPAYIGHWSELKEEMSNNLCLPCKEYIDKIAYHFYNPVTEIKYEILYYLENCPCFASIHHLNTFLEIEDDMIRARVKIAIDRIKLKLSLSN